MSAIDDQLLRLNRHLNAFAQQSELPLARFQALALIKQHNPITLRQLCDIQQVSMPTMSKLVDELQNQSLVIRAQSKDDARQRWIVPTQKGISELVRAGIANRKYWQQKLGKLNDEQLSQLDETLKLLLDSIESE